MIARRSLLAGVALVAVGCKRDREGDGTAPQAGSLPPLTLRDDTPDLMLTYLDERGDFHTTQRVSEIPEGFRSPVRVVVTSRDEGSATPLLYVADCSQKRPDGTYSVASMSRAQWESLAEQKRSQSRPASPVASSQPPPSSVAVGRVVIYGASWCGPCHDAQAFLKARSVAFVYHDIDVEDDARREMSRKLERAGQRGGTIPVIDVAGRIMVGFDPTGLRQALKAAFGDSAAL